MFVVLSGRSKDNSRSPLTVPVRCVACKGGLCFNPSSRIAQLAGALSLHVNRQCKQCKQSATNTQSFPLNSSKFDSPSSSP